MFNTGEKHTNEQMAKALEDAGFRTFLPQRDGFEFGLLQQGMMDLGLTEKQAAAILERVIFDFDAYQVMRTELTVYNNEGRTPDEGAVSENALGWGTMGKRAVFYSTDMRSLINGANNPLVTGLSGFRYATTHKEVIKQLQDNYALFLEENPGPLAQRVAMLRKAPRQTFENGKVIHDMKLAGMSNLQIGYKAIEIYCPQLLPQLKVAAEDLDVSRENLVGMDC